MGECICETCEVAENECPGNDAVEELEIKNKQLCEQLQAAQANEARMRGDYEAYVRNNCQLIRHSVVDGLGYPEEVNGKCGGYAQNYDEPHETCQKCVAVYDPETELDPPGPVGKCKHEWPPLPPEQYITADDWEKSKYCIHCGEVYDPNKHSGCYLPGPVAELIEAVGEVIIKEDGGISISNAGLIKLYETYEKVVGK